MKKTELKKIIREEILKEVGGGKNPEADKKVMGLIRFFSREYKIGVREAAEVIKSSLKRLGYY